MENDRDDAGRDLRAEIEFRRTDRSPTCQRRDGCERPTFGYVLDPWAEFPLAHCARHEPFYAAVERLRRDHPLFDAYVDMRWLDHLWRVMAAPFVAVWKVVRRGR